MSIIQLDEVTLEYRNTSERALADISLTVEEGEFLGVIGDTGSGKTSLLSVMCGVIPYLQGGTLSGTVVVDGTDVAEYGSVYEMASTISMVLQNPENQLSDLRVFDEIIWGPENLLDIEPEEIVTRGTESMELFGLEGFEDRITYNISGGEQQKVAIASIFAMHPKIMLLDEPTSQLDPMGTEQVFDAIDQLIEEGVTIVMATHKIEKLAAYADRIACLSDGRLQTVEATRSFFTERDAEGRPRPQVTELGLELESTVADDRLPLTLEEAERTYASYLDRTGA